MSFLTEVEIARKKIREQKAKYESRQREDLVENAAGSFVDEVNWHRKKIRERNAMEERESLLERQRQDAFVGPMPSDDFQGAPQMFYGAPLIGSYTSPSLLTHRDEINQGIADRINSVLLTGQTGTTLTYDDIVAQRDAATDAGERLELTSIANKKILYDNAQILAGAMMDGTNHSVLEEMYLIAEMENGKEKRERKKAVLAKMEELGVGTQDYALYAGDKNLTMGNFLDWAGSAAMSGLASFNKGITGTADLILGKPLQAIGWENNPISRVADYYSDTYDTYKYDQQLYADRMGGGEGLKFAGEAIEGTVGAIPHAILALMTMGTSLGGSATTTTATTTSALASKAAYETGGVLARAGITTQTMARNPQYWMSVAQSLSGDYEEAKANGASDLVASLAATATSLVNAGVEIGADGLSGIQGLPQKALEGDRGALMSWAISAVEEGGEEVVQGIVGNLIGQAAYDADPLRVGEIGRSFATGTIAGAALGGGQVGLQSAVNTAVETAAKKKLTANEQAVVDQLYSERIAEAEQKGTVTNKQKNEIRNAIIEEMEAGRISTDDIERILGGDAYKTYQDTISGEEALRNEFKELGEKETYTLADQARFTELAQQIKDLETNSPRNRLAAELSKNTYESVKGDRLVESYFEVVRSKQKFKADVNQYEGRAREVIQQVMDSELADNTRATHEFWDWVAKIATHLDTSVSLVNSEQILEMVKEEYEAAGKEFNPKDFEGQLIDGFASGKGIAINIDTQRALNFVVGHEVAHKLEQTRHYGKMQQLLFEYNKDEYDSRFNYRAGQYKNKYANDAKFKSKIDQEITGDMIGDYLFRDKNFIHHLTKDKGTFRAIWDEIKYMYEIATAGSEQQKQLAEVKREFERAWREAGKTQKNTATSGVSLSVETLPDGKKYVQADRQVIFGNDPDSWSEQVESYINKKIRNGENVSLIAEDGEVLTLTADTAGKIASNKTGRGTTLDDETFFVKANAGVHIDELAQASVNAEHGKKPKTDKGARHGAFAEGGWTYRNAFFRDFDGKYYRLTISAARGADGNVVYNIGNIEERTFPGVVGSSANGGALNGEGSFGATIAQEEPVVKLSISDSDGRQLSEGQQKYFADSKVRDENGNLKVVYHGSPADFNTFSLDYLGTNGTAEGYGFYFTDKKSIAENYSRGHEGQQNQEGGRLFEVYLDIKNPLSDTEVTMSRAQFRKFLTTLNKQVDADGEPLDVLSNYGDVAWEGLNKVLNYAMEIEYDGSDSDVNLVHSIINGCGNMETVLRVLRETTGYDGIIVNEATWGGDQTIYLAFHPEQIKNIDNLNPTSDPDIRHSLSNDGETFKPRGNYNVYGKDMAYAPVQETVAENATVEETVADDDAPWRDDGTPAQEELQAEIDTLREELDALRPEMDEEYSRYVGLIKTGEYLDDEQAFMQLGNHINKLAEEIEAREKRLDAALAAYAPMSEQDVTLEAERLGSIEDADAPPEYVQEAPDTKEIGRENVTNPFDERDWYEVGRDKKQHTFMHDHPEFKPFFIEEAKVLAGELDAVIKGERFATYNGYETVWTGNSRMASESIAEMLDDWRMSYKDIERGLKEIIENNGESKLAAAKRIEFMLNRRLLKGYYDTTVRREPFPPNKAYKEFLLDRERQAKYDGSLDNLLEEADRYAPPVEEDIAPVVEKPAQSAEGVAPEMEAPLYEGAIDNGTAQMAMWEEEQTEKPPTRKVLHRSIVDNVKARFAEKGFDFDNVLKTAKNLSTFATVDNTPQRVMEKALGYKEGGVLADLTVNQVAQNETEGIKWLNSFTDRKSGVLAQISKKYNIKPGSKESAAAQMYAEGFYVDENNDIIQYGDDELAKDFPDAKVQQNIKGLADDPRIRQIYDDTLAMINESRTRNAYPEIPRLDNYFLHFRAMEDTFSRLGLPFNPNDIRAKDLPTDLNGVTADLKPGQPYFASAMHRTGKRTSFDLLGGLEKYLTSAKNQIYHIDDIQTLRALRNYIADTYGQANGLEGLDELSEEEQQERIEQVYGAHLSTFAKFLNEEANVLAGKTALIDRGLEGIIGRRGITFLDTVNKQVGSNMVGLNISSSLTNFLPVAQTFAKTNKVDFVKAFGQTVANKIGSIVGRGDDFAENSPVIIRRKGADRFYRTPYQKVGDVGYAFMSAVDDISTELIARTKYNELTRKGMDSQQAHFETDKWVSKLMGDRSLGQQPQLYNSKMLGMITKFQLEVRNQLDSQFYDTIQEAKASNEDIQNALERNAKTAAKVASTFVQLAVVQHLFGMAFESVAGYNPAFDIIEVIAKAIGWDDEEESEDTVLDNVEQAFLTLLEDLPYTSTFTGGRIPISSALPVEQFVTGKDEYGNEKSRWETLAEVAPYYLLPTGYGQGKKTVQGVGMFSDEHPVAGSYTDSGNLRFPVDETLGSKVQAAVFGQWSSKNAGEYFDGERKPLNEKQTQEYIDLDLPISEYWQLQDTYKRIAKEAEGVFASDKDILSAKYIASVDSDLSALQNAKESLELGLIPDGSEYDEIRDKYGKRLPSYVREDLLEEVESRMDDLVNERADSYDDVTILRDGYAQVGSKYFKQDDDGDWSKMDDDQVTKYLAVSEAGDAHYATYGGVHYRLEEGGDWRNVSDWTKISDKQLERQNEVTQALGITPEEYWANTDISFIPMARGEYEYAYDNPENYAVASAVGGYDAYRTYSSELGEIHADKDENGRSISGSRKDKVLDYINSLDIEYGMRLILFKNEYNADDTFNNEIIDYLNSRDDISYEDTITILKELGFDVDANGNVTW